MGKSPKINWDEFPQFKRVTPAKFEARRKIKSMRLKRISLDEKYRKLKDENGTFLITNPEIVKNNTDIRNIDSIFSPLFGPDSMKPDSHEYSCECGMTIGGINIGKICKSCLAEVQYVVPDIRKPGFVDIAPFHVLSFHGMVAFKKLFGKDFDTILNSQKKIDITGKIIDVGEIDIIDLYERYDDEFRDKIGLPKDIIFTSKILVYNATLRPYHKRGNNITMFEVNKEYLSIVQLMRDLKLSSFLNNRMSQIKNLNAMQKHVNEVYNDILEKTKTKNGFFKTFIASGRVDYSARMVIVAGTELKPHEVILPYSTMMEIFEEELIEILCKMDNISIVEAYSRHAKALNHVDKKFLSIMKIFIKSREVWVMIDRNPTIKHGSILYMKVADIHTNIKNKTMAIPLDILNLQGADFDGDQETAIGQKTVVDSPYSYHEIFKRTFCPTYLFINRATGYFNRDMSFKKDQISIISELWNLSNAVCDFMEDPTIDSPSNMKIRRLLKSIEMDPSELEIQMESQYNLDSDYETSVYDEDLMSDED